MALTMQKLASIVAKLEGKRSQTSIGNVRETIRCTLDAIAADPDGADFLLTEFSKRADKLLKKVKQPKASKESV